MATNQKSKTTKARQCGAAESVVMSIKERNFQKTLSVLGVSILQVTLRKF